jgi:ribosomal protein L28
MKSLSHKRASTLHPADTFANHQRTQSMKILFTMTLSKFVALSSIVLHCNVGTALMHSHPSYIVSPFSQKYRSRGLNIELGAGSSPHLTEDLKMTSSTNHWATYALLFSSWTDGVAASNDAQAFLKYSLLRKMLSDKIYRHESEVTNSVRFSPCNGPDVNALNNLEKVDELIERGQSLLGDTDIICDDGTFNSWSVEVMNYLAAESNGLLEFRFLYIPTAMYALDPQSSNTPGKQRQRARADGKKRRDQVANLLSELFVSDGARKAKVNVCAITLDLDDGSLKQPIGFLDQASIPKVSHLVVFDCILL